MINNVGILHETLVTRCAQAITDNKTKTAASAIRLSKRFFASNKILNSELKLHLALSRPRDLTEQAATDLIKSVRAEAKKIDSKALTEQATKAAKIIAAAMQHERITVQQETYNRHILVGKLLSAWRKEAPFDKIAALESALCKSMCQKAACSSDDSQQAIESSALLNKMMTLRMAETYSDKLSDEHSRVLVAALKDDRKFLRERAYESSATIRAQSTDANLTPETRAALVELANKLDSAASDLKVIDDKFVAQLLACVDIEKEFKKAT